MFHVGDIIVGNQYANRHYGVTRTGTEWEVVRVFNDGRVQVHPGGWVVNPEYFDLKEPALNESTVDESELDNMFNEFE